MSNKIVEVLRERPFRYGSESSDQMQIRRQKERENGADEIERLRAALEVIAGRRQCADNLMSNVDIAVFALDK